MYIKLKDAIIKKYKSIETEQKVKFEDDITVLVGMNESGKTNILEALAKTNYFEDDPMYKFNIIHDYPRAERIDAEDSGEELEAITLNFEVAKDLTDKIVEDLDYEFDLNSFSLRALYKLPNRIEGISLDINDFLNKALKKFGLDEKNIEEVKTYTAFVQFDTLAKSLKTENPDSQIEFSSFKRFFDKIDAKSEYNYVEQYIINKWIKPNTPKFMYFDDYYALPARIDLNTLKAEDGNHANSEKTVKALLELSKLNNNKLVSTKDFEDFKAELEATQSKISRELFKYWKSNKNLNIIFEVDKRDEVDAYNNQKIVKKILDIRVQNTRANITLPLKNRSKGFNWFFSFLVWFNKIQADRNNTYILLLDEPGLNLHAMAQNDLLKFIRYLSQKYQIIYTTHSPFMIESDQLSKVRTVNETDNGTIISDSLQEKNEKTLFPLQAALGYDIAQNLFISKKNLIVEGISDLIYLSTISNILQEKGRVGLSEDITIIPVGGADKVATFISLLRGNELGMVCLLDDFKDPSAKDRISNQIKSKLISDKNVLYFSSYNPNKLADLEDVFIKEDYISLYNKVFDKTLDIAKFDDTKPVLSEINRLEGVERFNHYKPASYLTRNKDSIELSKDTLNRFEIIFKKINGLY